MMSTLDSPSVEYTLTLWSLDFSRMFVGGYKDRRAEIIEAELDGSHARATHLNGESDARITFDVESDDILIFKLLWGHMTIFGPTQIDAPVKIPSILPTDSTIRAVSAGMAIIRQPKGIYAFSFL